MISLPERLSPVDANLTKVAREAQEVLFDDYIRAGISVEQAQQMAYGHSDEKVTDITNALRHGPREYYGIREDGVLAAFASLSDWHYGDEPGFEDSSISEKLRMKLQARYRTGSNVAFPESHDGIFAFSIANLGKDYEMYSVRMLDALRDRAGQRGKIALRVTVDVADQDLNAFLQREKNHEEQALKVGTKAVSGVVRTYNMYELDTR